MREDRRRQKDGGFLAGCRVAVVAEVRGQGVGEPGVDFDLDVAVGSPGESVPDGFVAGTGLGLCQGAELAQRLELVGAGRDPHRFAQLGFPGVGGVGELGLDDVIGVRGVDAARRRGGKQLVDAFPLREFGRAAGVVGQVLVPGSLPGVIEGRRDGTGVRAPRSAPHDAPPNAAGSTGSRGAATRGRAVERSTSAVAWRHILVIFGHVFHGTDSERAATRAL